jgi:beta-1,4-mannosyl-glycoprotein beta-1,4-N-acetylglucosaminyltransferase
VRTFDCILFFNEIDLLDLRLHEYNDVVDYFCIVEASTTFSGNPKPFYFLENQQRYKNFIPKIIHIKVDNMPVTDNRWDRETFQRNAIVNVLPYTHPEDLVIISDADELWNKTTLSQIDTTPYAFSQRVFCYYLNYQISNDWRGSVAVRADQLHYLAPQFLRDIRNYIPSVINGGWHFGYLGGAEKIKLKIESFSHAEFDTIDVKSKIPEKLNRLEDVLLRREGKMGQIVPIDESFPHYLLRNIEKFKYLILES